MHFDELRSHDVPCWRLAASSLLLSCRVALLCSLFFTPTLRADLDEDMNRAIDEGVAWLLQAIEEENVINAGHEGGAGLAALETYALVVAGVDVKHPLIESNFKFLNRNPLNHTYSVSSYAFALDAAIEQVHGDKQFLAGKVIPDSPKIGAKYRGRLEECINSILRMKHADGGKWHYGPAPKDFCNSNTQFAVLALGVGAKRGMLVGPQTWEEIALHYMGSQRDGDVVSKRLTLKKENADDDNLKLVDEEGKELGPNEKRKKKKRAKSPQGRSELRIAIKPFPVVGDTGEVRARGWGYNDGGGPSFNMTNAGVSSLLLARQYLKGMMPVEFQNKLNQSLRDGLGYLLHHWSIDQSWPYYALYSIEKSGDLGHIKKFGDHDWFEEAAQKIVREQFPDGSWATEKDSLLETRRRTAFALLILNRATSISIVTGGRSRAERMVLTGPGAHDVDRSKRDDWVYIQDLGRELHLPSLFRTLRLRPHPKLLTLVKKAVKDYPFDRKGLLLPFLAKTYRESKREKVKKFLLSAMGDVTGAEYEKPAHYMVWFRRWKDIEEIGEQVKKEDIPYLLKYYEHTAQSIDLRMKVIWALTRCRAADAAPFLLDDLRHKESRVRQAAYEGLLSLPMANSIPLFNAAAKKGQRDKSIKKIRAWYEALSN